MHTSKIFLIFVINIIIVACILQSTKNEQCRLSTGFERQFMCTYMIVNKTNSPQKQCILEAFLKTGYSTVILMKFNDIMTRNVLQKTNTINCNTYILLVQDIKLLSVVFSHVDGYGRFYPFTNIMVIFDVESKFDEILKFDRDIFQYITSNSLNVVWINYHDFVNDTKNFEFHRVLSNELINIYPKEITKSNRSGQWSNVVRLFDEDKLINELLRNKHRLMNIRASFFQCPPFVYYVKNGNGTIFDGIEYRFLNEITKNWARIYTLRDPTKEAPNPWRSTLIDLGKNISDISMCSVWMIELHFHMCDLSKPYDTQCATFVVPKPTRLNQASLIYMPLNYKVWIAFVATLITTTILLKILSHAGNFVSEDKKCEKKFQNMTLSATEVINIVTSHGLDKFPVRLPIKVLIISWIFFSLLLGTGYTTGYTSLLTSPEYTKSIDTVSDFIQQGIGWGEPGKYPEMLDEFRQTGKPDYIELADRFTEEENQNTLIKKLENGKYGKFVKRLSDNFVTESDTYVHLSTSLQVMKECLGQYFTTFAFQKHSPFLKIFNRQIPRLVESGIIQLWFREIVQFYGDSRMQNLFDKSYTRQSDTIPLTLENLIGAFYLLTFGLALALVAFIFELILVKRITQGKCMMH